MAIFFNLNSDSSSVCPWNDLPKAFVDADNIIVFKNRVDDAWTYAPFKFNDKMCNMIDS